MLPKFFDVRPAVFFDRDGTLNLACGHITRPEQMRLIPGAVTAVRALRAAGFACIAVSNQPAVGLGLTTEHDLIAVHAEMMRQFIRAGTRPDAIRYCPAAPSTCHPDRMPARGMLLRVAREMQLDRGSSWMVSCNSAGLLAGRAAGCRGVILVRTGHDVPEALKLLTESDHVVEDVGQAARVILASEE